MPPLLGTVNDDKFVVRRGRPARSHPSARVSTCRYVRVRSSEYSTAGDSTGPTGKFPQYCEIVDGSWVVV